MRFEDHIENVPEDRNAANRHVDAGVGRDPGDGAFSRSHLAGFIKHDRFGHRGHDVADPGNKAENGIPADWKAKDAEPGIRALCQPVQPVDARAVHGRR